MARSSNRRPEADQAASEIANQEETRAASVADGEAGAEVVSREEIEETAEALITPVEEIEQWEDATTTDLLDEALSELGEPGEETPAPVVNAIALIRAAQMALQAGGVEAVGTLERAEEIDLHSPGESAPVSGLYRTVGSEVALSKGDRFPPPSPAFAWALFEQADQRGSRS